MEPLSLAAHDEAEDGDASDSGSWETMGASDDGADSMSVPGTRTRPRSTGTASSAGLMEPSAHAYLGDIDDLSGGYGLLPEGTFPLPVILLEDAVLMPGCSLPLKLSTPLEARLLRTALLAPPPLQHLLFAMNRHAAAELPLRWLPQGAGPPLCGCTAEVRRMGPAADGSAHVVAVAKQRACLLPSTRLPFPMQAARHDDALPGTWQVVVLREGCQQRAPRPVREGAAWAAPWAARAFDLTELVGRARRLAEVVVGPSAATYEATPLAFSYWLSHNLPASPPVRQMLLEAPHAAERLRMVLRLLQDVDRLVCGGCGTDVAAVAEVMPMAAHGPGSLFVNSHGYVHDIITLRSVGGIALSGEPTLEHSWFPGYAWTCAYCHGCDDHLGWHFTAVSANRMPRMFWGASGGSATVPLDIQVEGMMCGGCTSRVTEALQAVPLVKAVSVSLEGKTARVEVEAASQPDALRLLPQLVDTVKALGFEAQALT